VIRLTIPWEHLASSNLRNKRKGGRGHAWAYKEALHAIELHALDQYRGERPAFAEGSVRAWLDFYPPDNRKRDVLNMLKVTMDGIEGVAYTDDYQVSHVTVRRRWADATNPRVEITLETFGVLGEGA